MAIEQMSTRSKAEVLDVVRQYRQWHESGGDCTKYPQALKDLESPGLVKMVIGAMLHSFLAVILFLASRAHLQSIVRACAKARIDTDQWSFEPMQCGLNSAYTKLGLAYLKSGNVSAAVECLDMSWQVYPCAHNTSFGLRRRLTNALAEHPAAEKSVMLYREVANAFTV